MANWLTRVPATAPPFDETQRRLLPIVDVVMAVMWSRPGGLSLGNTWVTPATIWLCLGVALPAAILCLFMIGHGIASDRLLSLVSGCIGLLVAVGIGTVGVFGIRQRLLFRRVRH